MRNVDAITEYVTRADWGARKARPGPGDLRPDRVDGIALHWPAISKPIHGIAEVSQALRGWQAYHMDTRGWSDIAYQEAIDQAGNVYGLRGIHAQSGANGDQDVNERFGALLLVVAPGEQPSPLMVEAVRARVRVFRAAFPDGKRIVGHGDIRPEPTSCPGPAVTALIRAGAFEPTPGLTRGRYVDRAIRALRRAVAAAKPGGPRQGKLQAALDQLKAVRPWRRG